MPINPGPSIFPTSDNRYEKICWICYCSEAEDETPQAWIRPCRCCGSSQWVHQTCLHHWIDEKQRSDPNAVVSCRVCGYCYVLKYPPVGLHMVVLELFDRVVDITSTYCFVGAIIGSIYWSAVTYGALTVMQVFGHEASLAAMERIDPALLLLGLPAIPTTLIFLRLLRWQERLLRLWRKHVYTSPYLQLFRPKDIPVSRLMEADNRSEFELGSVPRVLCTALTLPTLALVCGRLFFSRMESRLAQALTGGAFYLTCTGFVSTYQKEVQFLRSCRRQVVEFASS